MQDKVLFLDVDGVIWTVPGVIYHRETHGERMPEHELDPVRLMLLQHLCKKVPDLKIVISSTWRLGTPLDKFTEYFGPIIGSRIIGKTPVLDRDRGREIKAWLDKNPTDIWAIVDDDSDMWPVIKGFFQTDSYDGLRWRDYVALESYFLGTEAYRKKVHFKKTMRWLLKQILWVLIRKPLWEIQLYGYKLLRKN
jgi:hypothetical protein